MMRKINLLMTSTALIAYTAFGVRGDLTKDPKTALIDCDWILSTNPPTQENISGYLTLEDINLIQSKQPVLVVPPIPRSRAQLNKTKLYWKTSQGTKKSMSPSPEAGTLVYTTIGKREELAGFTGTGGQTLKFKNTEIDSIIIQNAIGHEIQGIKLTAQTTPTPSTPQGTQQILKLNGTEQTVTDETIKNIFSTSTNYVTVSITESDSITDAGIEQMVKNAPHLRRLLLAECPQITDNSIKTIGENCPDLTELRISWCPLITDDALKFLPKKITHLSLTIDEGVRGPGLRDLPTSITSLDLRGSFVTAKGVIDASQLKDLAELNLENASQVDQKGLRDLLATFPALQTLTTQKGQVIKGRTKILAYLTGS